MLRNKRLLFSLAVWLGAAPAAHAERDAIRGRVLDAASHAPIEGATVFGDHGEPVATDRDGRFVLPGGATSLTVVAGDHEAAVVGPADELVVELARKPGSADGAGGEVIAVSGERPRASPGAVSVERAEVVRLPGARGDLLSGLKNLPGVANNGSLTPLSAGLIIRGSSPKDSRILVDGFEVPVLYHFLGLQSVLATEMIDNIEYAPGAFSVAHGKASGGIVSVTSRDEAKVASAFAELSFVNASGLVQGPIGDRASYAVAARRSVIDAVLPAVLSGNRDLSFTAYPRYYDYQAKLSYRPSADWKLATFLFGSDDRVVMLNQNDNAEDPAASGGLSNRTSFTRLISSASFRRAELSVVAAASAYTDTNHFAIGPARHLKLDRDGVATRSELTWEASDRLRVIAGGEAEITRTRFDLKFSRPPSEGDPNMPNFSTDTLLENVGSATITDLGGWSSVTAWPVRSLELTGGLRIDAFLRNDVTVVQPRGQVVWHAAAQTTLRAASGVYVRPPEFLDEGLQKALGAERSWQSSVGGEQQLAPGLTLQATAYHNRMSDLLVLPVDRRSMAAAAGYENLGEGRATGIELMLKLRSETAFGWVSYTGARATRRDLPGGPSRLFDYDQTHNVIVVGSWRPNPRWQLGGRFQLTTGKPYTPVLGATYHADTDLYTPTYGAVNSRRVAAQHQLDLRVDRTWRFERWKLSAYLDVSNVYINAATIDYDYNFDYTSRTDVTTLPILPSIGVRGEM